MAKFLMVACGVQDLRPGTHDLACLVIGLELVWHRIYMAYGLELVVKTFFSPIIRYIYTFLNLFYEKKKYFHGKLSDKCCVMIVINGNIIYS